MITPRILKGFRDHLPETMIPKNKIIRKLENIFEKYGFSPIDTPALEYTEILLGKGGGETDKQIYSFKDHGDRDISLRFDLTVPLARFISQHYNELVFPFKSFHIGPVWRGENPQKGRYREFYQCDFDILGNSNVEADIEILLLIKSGLLSLNCGDFKIFVNNRKILNAIIEKLGLKDKSVDILRTIDKIYKIGYKNVLKELIENIKINEKTAKNLLDLLNITEKNDKNFNINGDLIFEVLNNLKQNLGQEYSKGVLEMEYVFKALKKAGFLDHYCFNPAITRGLDYYTGIVFESFVTDRINFGSICSGGRYDNLTGLYSKTPVTGVGASFGLDRIMALLEDKKILDNSCSNTDLLIFNLDENFYTNYIEIAEKLREKNINTEIYLEQKKLNTQFKYAEKKSINYVLFAGEEEINNNSYNLKNLNTKEEKKSLSIDEIIKEIKNDN